MILEERHLRREEKSSPKKNVKREKADNLVNEDPIISDADF